MTLEKNRISPSADLRVGARKSLELVLQPLTDFFLGTGLSIKDLQSGVRMAAVRTMALRQLEVHHRVNISGISASTGISRAEVAKILRSAPKPDDEGSDHQQSTNRILSAWFEDPRFRGSNGQPSDLKIYGRGPTFESLVKLHGKGVPARAMLDELLRTQAVEMRSPQLIRFKSHVAADHDVTPLIVRVFGERVSELMATLVANMRNPENSTLVSSAGHTKIPVSELPCVRAEVFAKGTEFVEVIREILARGSGSINGGNAKGASSVSVTIFCREESRLLKAKQEKKPSSRRKNFRRDL